MTEEKADASFARRRVTKELTARNTHHRGDHTDQEAEAIVLIPTADTEVEMIEMIETIEKAAEAQEIEATQTKATIQEIADIAEVVQKEITTDMQREDQATTQEIEVREDLLTKDHTVTTTEDQTLTARIQKIAK